VLEVEDDIWVFYPHAWVVIPTNIGWNDLGMNIMGVGLAKDAASRFPDLPAWYGSWCKAYGANTPVMASRDHQLILFPTKQLDANSPGMSWKQPSSIDLIEKGLKELCEISIEGEIALPLLGCGAGRLSETQVLPLMKTLLPDDRFIFVRQPSRGDDDHPF